MLHFVLILTLGLLFSCSSSHSPSRGIAQDDGMERHDMKVLMDIKFGKYIENKKGTLWRSCLSQTEERIMTSSCHAADLGSLTKESLISHNRCEVTASSLRKAPSLKKGSEAKSVMVKFRNYYDGEEFNFRRGIFIIRNMEFSCYLADEDHGIDEIKKILNTIVEID
jgi:hypothetical protein